MSGFRITYDKLGTPGILADDVVSGFRALGVLHARHRPLQTLLITVAARGQIAQTLVPRGDLVDLDRVVHRFDIPRIGVAEADLLDDEAARRVDAYVAGMREAFTEQGMPLELRMIGARVPLPDRASVVGGLLVGACLGLAQAQERMERAIVDALAAKADADVLASIFAPHLEGFSPSILRSVMPFESIVPTVPGITQSSGGSNAWAVSPLRSASGKPLVAGDPHLQANQLPALMFEVRARVADEIWLGSTIPGLPGIGVGRNKRVAWSGTFGVADNVDHWVEPIAEGMLVRDGKRPGMRDVHIRRRFRGPLREFLYTSPRGVLSWDGHTDGIAVSSRWAATSGVASTLSAYVHLPFARDAAEAERVLQGAQTLTLHFVVADVSGDVRYVQVGRIPERSGGWSGLYPTERDDWVGVYTGSRMPRERAVDGVQATANEARLAPDGATLSTLAQPAYRRTRILELLTARDNHDVASMQAIQNDLTSLQGHALAPLLERALPDGPLKKAVQAWDKRYDPDSVGAHAFDLARTAALKGLAPLLGGDWFLHALRDTELPVWWCTALDRLLARTLSGDISKEVHRELGAIAGTAPSRWGDVQRITYSNIILGGLPSWLGFSAGPYALPGSIATVSQGSIVRSGGNSVATAPVYRFVTDLAEEAAYTSMPGGIDGSRFHPTYMSWLDEHRAGRYHRIAPPDVSEV